MRERDSITDTPKAADARRFWCAYTALEEYHAGMWRRISGEEAQLRAVAAAVALLRDRARFAQAILRVLVEWPTSCRAEFTSPGNHLAWLGQAACCLAVGVPEDLTRRAWWKLSEEDREAANIIARKALEVWRE
jgi:hypothetical protein